MFKILTFKDRSEHVLMPRCTMQTWVTDPSHRMRTLEAQSAAGLAQTTVFVPMCQCWSTDKKLITKSNEA